MNQADKVINEIAIQFANSTIERANYKVLYEEAQTKLEETQEQLLKVNKVLQSDEKLKELFDETAEKLEKE
jgi:ferritin-like metal-binding protein YciE